MDNNFFLLTQQEYKEIVYAIECAGDIGYTDITATMAENVGAVYAIMAVINVAERSQQERIQTLGGAK